MLHGVGYIVEIVGLHCRGCWIIWWGMGWVTWWKVLGYMVECFVTFCGVLGKMVLGVAMML